VVTSRSASSHGIIDLRRRLAAGELGTALLMEGNFSQDKFFALSPGQLAPVCHGRSGRPAVRHRRPPHGPVDRAASDRPVGGMGPAGEREAARLPTATRSACMLAFESGAKNRAADCNFGNAIRRAAWRVFGSQGCEWRSATSTHHRSTRPDGT